MAVEDDVVQALIAGVKDVYRQAHVLRRVLRQLTRRKSRLQRSGLETFRNRAIHGPAANQPFQQPQDPAALWQGREQQLRGELATVNAEIAETQRQVADLERQLDRGEQGQQGLGSQPAGGRSYTDAQVNARLAQLNNDIAAGRDEEMVRQGDGSVIKRGEERRRIEQQLDVSAQVNGRTVELDEIRKAGAIRFAAAQIQDDLDQEFRDERDPNYVEPQTEADQDREQGEEARREHGVEQDEQNQLEEPRGDNTEPEVASDARGESAESGRHQVTPDQEPQDLQQGPDRTQELERDQQPGLDGQAGQGPDQVQPGGPGRPVVNDEVQEGPVRVHSADGESVDVTPASQDDRAMAAATGGSVNGQDFGTSIGPGARIETPDRDTEPRGPDDREQGPQNGSGSRSGGDVTIGTMTGGAVNTAPGGVAISTNFNGGAGSRPPDQSAIDEQRRTAQQQGGQNQTGGPRTPMSGEDIGEVQHQTAAGMDPLRSARAPEPGSLDAGGGSGGARTHQERQQQTSPRGGGGRGNEGGGSTERG
jgi:hypothetical protein